MHWLVKSVIKNAIKVAGNAVVANAVPLGDYLAGVFEDACRHSAPEAASLPEKPSVAIQADMRQEFGRIAQDPAKFKADADELLAKLDLQPAERETALALVAQVPGRIQASMRRPDDPTGKTVPVTFGFDSPKSLAPFLPERLPRFRAGDVAVPGTDLVVQELLGVGGFGEVWKASHKSRPYAPPVALKFCTDPAAVKSLRKEVHLIDRVASAGQHPNIVDLKGVYGLDTDSPCLEYEFIDGGDLAGWAAKAHAAGTVDPAKVAQLMLVLARAVGHLHRLTPPVVHRDLKPANILMAKRDGKTSPKVADFGIGGIASAKDLADARQATVSGSTTSLGSHTPLYASPQQVNLGPPDPRDDVYALGVIWFQLVLGDLSKRPQGGSWRKKFGEAGVPAGMVELIERCVDGEAGERPADAQALADELTGLLKPSQVITPLQTPLATLAPLPPLPPLPGFAPMEPLRPFEPLKPFGQPPAEELTPEWHYADGAKKGGPVSIGGLRGLIAAGTVSRSVQVWKAGMPQWVAGSSVPNLLSPEPPPLPPPVPEVIAVPPPLTSPPPSPAHPRARLVVHFPSRGPGLAKTLGSWAGRMLGNQRFRVAVNGEHLGECPAFDDASIAGEMPCGRIRLNVAFIVASRVSDSKEFEIDAPLAGTYQFQFKFIQGALGGIKKSTLDMLAKPGETIKRG